jgi:hypothetical protein
VLWAKSASPADCCSLDSDLAANGAQVLAGRPGRPAATYLGGASGSQLGLPRLRLFLAVTATFRTVRVRRHRARHAPSAHEQTTHRVRRTRLIRWYLLCWRTDRVSVLAGAEKSLAIVPRDFTSRRLCSRVGAVLRDKTGRILFLPMWRQAVPVTIRGTSRLNTRCCMAKPQRAHRQI